MSPVFDFIYLVIVNTCIYVAFIQDDDHVRSVRAGFMLQLLDFRSAILVSLR